MVNSAPNAYFICFMARSGSTWLGKILSSHPDVLYVQHPFMNPHGKLTNWQAKTLGKHVVRLSQYRGHKYDCEPYFPQPADPKAVVIKDSHAAQAPELCARYGRLIVLIRNPFAVVNSLINHYPAASQYGMESSAKRWAQRNDKYLELIEQDPEQAIMIRYEDLANTMRARREVERLIKWMGLKKSDEPIKFVEQSRATHDNHHLAVHKNPKITITAWKHELSKEGKEIIMNAVAGSRAGRLYDL